MKRGEGGLGQGRGEGTRQHTSLASSRRILASSAWVRSPLTSSCFAAFVFAMEASAILASSDVSSAAAIRCNECAIARMWSRYSRTCRKDKRGRKVRVGSQTAGSIGSRGSRCEGR